MTQLYYDTFTGEVVTDVDEIAPPERYIRVHCGDGVFIEKWSVENGRLIDVAYTPFDRKNGLVDAIRRAIEEKHNVRLQYMTDWTVTEEHYKKMLKEAEMIPKECEKCIHCRVCAYNMPKKKKTL